MQGPAWAAQRSLQQRLLAQPEGPEAVLLLEHEPCYTVARAAFRGSGFAAGHGAGFRGVMDLAQPDGAYAVIATGQSGHPFSRHWGDMLPLWRDGALLPLAAPREVTGRIRLTPAP